MQSIEAVSKEEGRNAAQAGAIANHEAIAVGGENERDMEGGGVVEALLHPVAERALSSVLQNVFDAWMTLLGQPLQPISEYLEHVPPELNRQDSHGVLDRRFYRH